MSEEKRPVGRPRKHPIGDMTTMSDTGLAAARPAMRPEMRDDDPRTRAARRAAEIREHIGEMDDGDDEYRAPAAPDGWTYEWKRNTVFNQPDPAYQVDLKRKGWEEVPASRHPEMMPQGTRGHAPIERKGMILMERPSVIVDESRAIDRRRARLQVQVKEQQLTGEPVSGMGPNMRPDIKKAYEPLPVTDE